MIDILLDLKHDFGKYLFLHLSHLTADSPEDMIREALRTALFETRRISGTVRTAEEIWGQYRSEIDALKYAFNGYDRLVQCVDDALSLHRFLIPESAPHPPHVGHIHKVARQVSEVIAQIIAEENSDR
ncbi:MAG: hypothetical protein JXR76_16100 [Deltaproteobacteria bacterium]|nr:hypothetical protein [Deltaproteobacteria bacterium]